MTPQEVSILDVLDRALAERDKTLAAQLSAIGDRVNETREDVRGILTQLVGVATSAEIASHKRWVAEEFEKRDRAHAELARAVDVLEDEAGERDALRRQRNRALAAAATLATIAIGLAGVLIGLL